MFVFILFLDLNILWLFNLLSNGRLYFNNKLDWDILNGDSYFLCVYVVEKGGLFDNMFVIVII